MAAKKYLENLYVQHWLGEIDKSVDRYLAARGRNDLAEMEAATKDIDRFRKAVETRKKKIDEGKRKGEAASGDMDLYGVGTTQGRKKTPAAVRKESE